MLCSEGHSWVSGDLSASTARQKRRASEGTRHVRGQVLGICVFPLGLWFPVSVSVYDLGKHGIPPENKESRYRETLRESLNGSSHLN